MVWALDKPPELADPNCLNICAASWDLDSSTWTGGRALLHANTGRLGSLRAAAYLWMAVRSLGTGGNSSSFFSGSTCLGSLLVFTHIHWDLPLPLPQFFFQNLPQSKTWRLESPCTDWKSVSAGNFLSSHVFKVCCPFPCLNWSAFWRATYLVWCYYTSWYGLLCVLHKLLTKWELLSCKLTILTYNLIFF